MTNVSSKNAFRIVALWRSAALLMRTMRLSGRAMRMPGSTVNASRSLANPAGVSTHNVTLNAGNNTIKIGKGTSYAELDPRLFSFNSKHGWCEGCFGTGLELAGDPAFRL